MTHAYSASLVAGDTGPDGGVVHACIHCGVKMSANKSEPSNPWFERDAMWVLGSWTDQCPGDNVTPQAGARKFDRTIGRLDRLLSEFLVAAGGELDEADRQTIKHHADDLIGVGKKALELVTAKDGQP